MPKASRGRRPAPNPKKRAQRQGPRSFGVAAPVAAPQSANGGGAATAVAPRPVRPAASSWSAPGRRAATPAAPHRRFSESLADYAYVGDDLRRIALLAGGLLIFMVALSFFIR